GEVLAIEPIDGVGPGWLLNDPGTYPGGGDYFISPGFGVNTFTSSGFADDFETFVTFAPEPSGLSLLGAALFGLGIAWICRCQRSGRARCSVKAAMAAER